MMLRAFASLLAAVLATACASTPRRDPAAQWAGLEARLLDASQVEVTASVQTEGALSATLEGRMALVPVDRAQLAFSGSFAGTAVTPTLEASAGRLRYGAQGPTREAVAGAELNRALLVGLLRMGITHNLAQLSSDAPPDHMDGGVDAWVTVGKLRERSIAGFGRVPKATPLAFDIYVDGKYTAEGVLWLGPDGLPLERHQRVHFPSGDMRVTERYRDWKLVD